MPEDRKDDALPVWTGKLWALVAPACWILLAYGYVVGRSRVFGYPAELVLTELHRVAISAAVGVPLVAGFFAITLFRTIVPPKVEPVNSTGKIEKAVGWMFAIFSIVLLVLDWREWLWPLTTGVMAWAWISEGHERHLAEVAGDSVRADRVDPLSNPSAGRANLTLITVTMQIGAILLSHFVGIRIGVASARSEETHWVVTTADKREHVVLEFLGDEVLAAPLDRKAREFSRRYLVVPSTLVAFHREPLGALAPSAESQQGATGPE